MANTNLSKAKSAKNDEFYTQYADIQKEVNAYLDYDANVFRGKTILLPCDDPEWSNFTKFFAQNFERFGLKKLISTSYAIESKNIKQVYQPTLFETAAPQFDSEKTRVRGKIFVLGHDTNKNGRIDIEDLEWDYLKGDGDFRSDEVKKLRDEADNAFLAGGQVHRLVGLWDAKGNLRRRAVAGENGSDFSGTGDKDASALRANILINQPLNTSDTKPNDFRLVNVGQTRRADAAKTYFVNVMSAGPDRQFDTYDDIWSFPDDFD